ncbi:formate-dependent phosphoribosylglycinamide formyltransferase [Marinicella gelatinilytica]|uniref:formate-dependent phosphoribosylglycinamide formyltransferase n=1 Tax=Marinicella gelatinilytica TaxID=2996017 RepID=UPI002260888D|nr:formate-dependent phosphoribosylglycinamide formyltransferase [Marinicella gelatinilytica]MCX7544758.1 formate-dependent phosphoribosylglycinamide formyltransferase [Marinicella gelatinilytica]
MKSFFSQPQDQPIKLLLLGAGELGKELTIEAQRMGINVVAVDRYNNAPAMQVAQSSRVINMLDAVQLAQLIKDEKPDLIVPEIEAIATAALIKAEQAGFRVVPSAKAADLTLNRKGIRHLAAEELGIETSDYRFVDNYPDFCKAVETIGLPCVVKPVISSSGKGQTIVREPSEFESAWRVSQEAGRAGAGEVIVESFIKYDFEITQLTVQHAQGVTFCEPIGHLQQAGDYIESWQPQALTATTMAKVREMSEKITTALGGWGIFGVEFFIRGEDVIFSEVSPRPHDTGMVTMVSQDLSQFALHLRAILGLPIPAIKNFEPSASKPLLGTGQGNHITYTGVAQALTQTGTQVRLFGKPEINGQRRLGVCLATARSLNAARKKVNDMAVAIAIHINSKDI